MHKWGIFEYNSCINDSLKMKLFIIQLNPHQVVLNIQKNILEMICKHNNCVTPKYHYFTLLRIAPPIYVTTRSLTCMPKYWNMCLRRSTRLHLQVTGFPIEALAQDQLGVVGSKMWFWRRLKFHLLWKISYTYTNENPYCEAYKANFGVAEVKLIALKRCLYS